jgi:hypothetical protein
MISRGLVLLIEPAIVNPLHLIRNVECQTKNFDLFLVNILDSCCQRERGASYYKRLRYGHLNLDRGDGHFESTSLDPIENPRATRLYFAKRGSVGEMQKAQRTNQIPADKPRA